MAEAPHNREAEETLVQRLLLNPKQLALVAGSLKPEHFWTISARQVYAAMLALDKERKIIDAVSLQERLGKPLPEWQTGRLHHGNLEGYAEIIRRDAIRRESITQLEKAVAVAYQETDVEVLISAIGNAVQAITEKDDRGALSSPDSTVDDYLAALERRRTGLSPGFTWGVPVLDKYLLPARPQNVIIIGARPSVGKTALVEFIADHWARQGRGAILFVSLEMSKEELMDRAISRAIGTSTDLLIRGTLTEEQWRLATAAADELRQVAIWTYDKGSTTMARIRSEAARVRMMTGGLGAIIIDYLGLVEEKEGGDSQVTRITRISQKIKRLAKDFNVPVLVAAQLNRQSEYRKDPRPTLADLRDSGAIEQDADTVLGLHRASKMAQAMDVGILKQRQGGGADRHVTIRFDGETMTFKDYVANTYDPLGVTPVSGTPVGNPVDDDTDNGDWT